MIWPVALLMMMMGCWLLLLVLEARRAASRALLLLLLAALLLLLDSSCCCCCWADADAELDDVATDKANAAAAPRNKAIGMRAIKSGLKSTAWNPGPEWYEGGWYPMPYS